MATALRPGPASRLLRLGRARPRSAPTDLVFVLALVVLAVIVVAGVLGRLTGVGGDPSAIVGPRLSPPASGWWLGTDNLGRSELARLLEGIGTTLLLSAVAVALTAVVSTAVGVLAGYRGGRTAEVITRIVDVLYAFPAVVLAILVAAVIGPGQVAALASSVLITLPLMTRMVTAQARSVAGRDFVLAARVSGLSAPWIMWQHVLRNLPGVIAVQATYSLSVAILVEGGLSFLGFGVQAPGSSLGLLVQDGSFYAVRAPWLAFAPSVVIVLAIVSINLVGDGLRDRFEIAGTNGLK